MITEPASINIPASLRFFALFKRGQSLGLAEFDAAWAEGATLADEEASALLASLLPPALGSG